MANFTTASGVVLNDTERELIQYLACLIYENYRDPQYAFRYFIALRLNISMEDVQVFTLC